MSRMSQYAAIATIGAGNFGRSSDSNLCRDFHLHQRPNCSKAGDTYGGPGRKRLTNKLVFDEHKFLKMLLKSDMIGYDLNNVGIGEAGFHKRHLHIPKCLPKLFPYIVRDRTIRPGTGTSRDEEKPATLNGWREVPLIVFRTELSWNDWSSRHLALSRCARLSHESPNASSRTASSEPPPETTFGTSRRQMIVFRSFEGTADRGQVRRPPDGLQFHS